MLRQTEKAGGGNHISKISWHNFSSPRVKSLFWCISTGQSCAFQVQIPVQSLDWFAKVPRKTQKCHNFLEHGKFIMKILGVQAHNMILCSASNHQLEPCTHFWGRGKGGKMQKIYCDEIYRWKERNESLPALWRDNSIFQVGDVTQFNISLTVCQIPHLQCTETKQLANTHSLSSQSHVGMTDATNSTCSTCSIVPRCNLITARTEGKNMPFRKDPALWRQGPSKATTKPSFLPENNLPTTICKFSPTTVSGLPGFHLFCFSYQLLPL